MRGQELTKFSQIESPKNFALKPSYYRVYHDLENHDDPGYVAFFDSAKDRYIFFTSGKVGQSEAFHNEKRSQ